MYTHPAGPRVWLDGGPGSWVVLTEGDWVVNDDGTWQVVDAAQFRRRFRRLVTNEVPVQTVFTLTDDDTPITT